MVQILLGPSQFLRAILIRDSQKTCGKSVLRDGLIYDRQIAGLFSSFFFLILVFRVSKILPSDPKKRLEVAIYIYEPVYIHIPSSTFIGMASIFSRQWEVTHAMQPVLPDCPGNNHYIPSGRILSCVQPACAQTRIGDYENRAENSAHLD